MTWRATSARPYHPKRSTNALSSTFTCFSYSMGFRFSSWYPNFSCSVPILPGGGGGGSGGVGDMDGEDAMLRIVWWR